MSSRPPTISKATERRVVLGLQGLWPGWRWRGARGLLAALPQLRAVQVDPLDVVGHNHDLVFASRVLDYRPADLDRLLYVRRAGFEYGGTIEILPRELLRLQVSWVRHQGLPTRWEAWERAHARTVARVRAAVTERGPLDARAWPGGERSDEFRSGSEEAIALYLMWRKLELMVHHREGLRKVYDLTERLFGPLPDPIPAAELVAEFDLERLRWLGLSGQHGIPYLRTIEAGRGRTKVTKRQVRQQLVDSGRLVEVEVEGERMTSVLRTEDAPLLEAVAAGEIPRAWRPIDDTREARFLAPLDIVFTRGRGAGLFDFEYLWEVYKPAPKRRWGYYVLPVLLDDRIIGRVDPSFDRQRNALSLDRAWWEPGADLKDAAVPFARGIGRVARRLGARSVRIGRIGPPSFRADVRRALAADARAGGTEARPSTDRSPSSTGRRAR
jgi:uncharacterized protein